MKSSTTFKTFAIIVAALGTAVAPAAFAVSANEVSISIDARYLETDWGVAKVYDKLSHKAESACDVGHTRNLTARKMARDCMSNLLDDFIKNAKHEKLTAYHESKIS